MEREEEILNEIEKIDKMRGFIQAIVSGYVHGEMSKAAYKYQKEVESGEKVIIGKNAYTIPDEEDTLEDEEPPHRVVPEAVEKHLANLEELRRTRDRTRHRKALKELERASEEGENLFRPLIETTKAYATIEEIAEVVPYHSESFVGKRRNLLEREGME